LVSRAVCAALVDGHVDRGKEALGESTGGAVREAAEVRGTDDDRRSIGDVGVVGVNIQAHAGAALLGRVSGAGEATLRVGDLQRGRSGRDAAVAFAYSKSQPVSRFMV